MAKVNGSDFVVVDGRDGACGVVSYWELSGALELGALQEAWAAEGLDVGELPKLPTSTEAMARAAKGLQERRLLARPLGGYGEGWALVREVAKGDKDSRDLEHGVVLKVFTDDLERLVVEPHDHRLAGELRGAYLRHLGELSSQDVSSWLTRLSRTVQAVALRAMGGVYFVPNQHTARWSSVARALRACSGHRVYELPALRTEDAVAAVLDAITREARELSEGLEAELASEDGVKPRAAQGKVLKVEGALAKLASYEALLGVKAEAVREGLEHTRSALAVAALTTAETDVAGGP